MISKKLHLSLIKKWQKYGKTYQNRNKRVLDRLKWFKKHLKLLDGLKVLEVGCNAGLFAIQINRFAKWYVGLEKKVSYYKQSLITEKYIHEVNEDFGWDNSCHFFNRRLGEYFDNKKWLMPNEELMNPNALVLSRVLYYLKDNDIEVLKKVLKNCKVALVLCGSKNDRKLNKYGFHKAENTKKFFKDQGFKFEVDLVHSRYYGGVATK